MSGPGRSIFRASAVEAYRRRTEQDIVPRLVSRRIVAGFWLLLTTLVGVAVLAWWVRIPTYVRASGVVVGDTAAVLFVAPDESDRLRPGRPVRGQIGSSDNYVRGAIAKVAAGTIGPDAARKHFPATADVTTEPAVAVSVRLAHPLPAAAYGGSRLNAQVEIGSQRLLALFPGVGQLVGGAS